MDNKVQELTDKLYQQGLSKGKEEAETILAKAKEEAASIIDNANKKAEDIINKANKESDSIKMKAEGDAKMAASQILQSTKKEIENIIVGKMTDASVSASLKDADFIKKIIIAVAEKFNVQESVDLNVVLPESMKAQLEPFVADAAAQGLKGGINASFSKKISGGFNIGPADGSYFVSLTDETFKELIGEYLRPTTRKILFGE